MLKRKYRLYDPLEGSIEIDSQPITSLKLLSFRKQISVASQSTILFNDSILFNLQYANPAKTKEEIIEICKEVNLHDFIMTLPQNYETSVGEAGSLLSGGERQRIALARCLLKEAKILLLDEVTSSLDSYNEGVVMELIKRLKEKYDLTIVMITHRMHLNNFVDEVIMLKTDGTVEKGKHSEMIQNHDSKYYNLWQEFTQKVKYSQII
jgi:ABC-type multidrug transport system fused ATPase/permease subunit